MTDGSALFIMVVSAILALFVAIAWLAENVDQDGGESRGLGRPGGRYD